MDELKTINNRNPLNPDGRHFTNLIDITAASVWGSEGWGNMGAFDFSRGSPAVGADDAYRSRYSRYYGARALPVRDVKDNTSAHLPKRKEPSPDGSFITYANGIVYDTKTGLEWVTGPDRGTTWDEANDWVESLNIDGGGWRMPTMNELEGLYKKGMGSHNITSLLKTTGWYVWSGEIKDSSEAWGFNFFYGSNSYWSDRYGDGDWDWDPRFYSHFERGFAVRSRSDG